MKILSFGEILFDIIEGEEHMGGASLNFAVHAARLGASVSLFSSLGKDKRGERAINFLRDEAINSSCINDSLSPTGTVEVSLNDGSPHYLICEDVAWDHISPGSEQWQILLEDEWDLLYVGTLAQRGECSRQSLKTFLEKGKARQIFYDLNLRQNYYSKEIIDSTLCYSTIVKMNDEEVPVLSHLFFGKELEFADFSKNLIARYNLKILIITSGSQGAIIYTGLREYPLVPEVTEVVDTVGAGDSFSAAFACSWIDNGDIEAAGKVALSLASFVVSSRGGTPRYSEELKGALSL